MIEYKKYIQVLEILKGQLKHDLTGGFALSDFSDITDEMKASAICELFDIETLEPDSEYDIDLRTCQPCGCLKGVTCPGY